MDRLQSFPNIWFRPPYKPTSNPTVFPVSKFRSKLAAGNHFLRSVMKEKRLFLLGTENELAKLASK